MIYATLVRHAIQLGGAFVVLIILYAYGNHSGRAHVQALWDEEKAATAIAANEAIMNRLADNEKLKATRTEELKQVKESYENQIIDLGKRPASRLYLPKAAKCNGITLPSNSANTNGLADPPGSIRLPERVEEDIQSLIDKADVIRIRLTELQKVCK